MVRTFYFTALKPLNRQYINLGAKPFFFFFFFLQSCFQCHNYCILFLINFSSILLIFLFEKMPGVRYVCNMFFSFVLFLIIITIIIIIIIIIIIYLFILSINK